MATCWAGPASPFEALLLQPMATYALEQLRQRFLFTLTSNNAPVPSARVVLQMAYETEVGAVLTKFITTPAGFADSVVCLRRNYIDIDADMQKQSYLINPAVKELYSMPSLPTAYVDFFVNYLNADYPRYRMSSIAGALCMAKAVQ